MTDEAHEMRVYVIDDDPDHMMIIRRAIREVASDIEVCPVDDGATALSRLACDAGNVDLILLDINMTGLDGFEVLERLKADARLKLIPVVMLTSSERSSDIARAYELGASGYISKPSYLHDLRAVLGNTLLYWTVMKRATNGTA